MYRGVSPAGHTRNTAAELGAITPLPLSLVTLVDVIPLPTHTHTAGIARR